MAASRPAMTREHEHRARARANLGRGLADTVTAVPARDGTTAGLLDTVRGVWMLSAHESDRTTGVDGPRATPRGPKAARGS